MINILVVDDEPISADGISIYLQEHGDRSWVVNTAYNGIQALEFARQRVDILVSDIMMPSLDGFQLQEKIQQMWPMSRCVFLTCVQQIDYVQRAIRSESVTDYVLKTEREEKILDAVRKAIISQENVIHTQDLLQKAEQDILKVRPLLQNELILSLLHGEYLPFSLEQRFRELGMSFQVRQPVLLLLGQIGDESNNNRSADLSGFMLNHIMEKYFLPSYHLYTVSLSQQRIAILLQSITVGNQDVKYVFSMMEVVQQTFQKAGGTVSFAVDDVYCLWDKLSAHYRALVAVLERNLFLDDALVLRSDGDELPEHTPVEDLYKVRVLLESGSYDQAAAALSEIRVPQTVRGRIELYRKLLKLLVAVVDAQEIAEDIYGSLHIPNLQTDESGWRNTQSEFASIFRRLTITENTPFKRMEETIENVCSYVKKNLSGDISLAHLADLTDYSPTYLSRMFKEVKGIGYNDFVIEKRMEQASYLLRDTKLKLSEIAEQTGYASSSYFIRTFRHAFGITPTEYRNRLKDKKQ